MALNKDQKIAFFYCSFQFIVLAIVCIACLKYVNGIVQDKIDRHTAYTSTKLPDPGFRFISPDQLDTKNAQPVHAGLFLERIEDVDIIRSKWSYQFYVWFEWNPKKVNFYDGINELGFSSNKEDFPVRLIDGDITSIETDRSYLNPNGDSAYARFYIKGSTSKFFDVTTFPLDDHFLQIQMEHKKLSGKQMYFLTDYSSIERSGRLTVNGYVNDTSKNILLSKMHVYRTSFDDPSMKQGEKEYRSQLRACFNIERSGVGIYLKIFIFLYISLLVAFLSFFVHEDKQLGIIMGCLFTVAATLSLIGGKIPTTSHLSIGELLIDVSIVTLFLIVLHETIAKFAIIKSDQLKKYTHWGTFGIALFFYLLMNIAIPIISLRH